MLVTADEELERHSIDANLNCTHSQDARSGSKFGSTAKPSVARATGSARRSMLWST